MPHSQKITLFHFQACTTVTSNSKVNGDDPHMEDSPQAIKERMSPQEWNTIYKMSQDKTLYQNLITSLFPTIHGNEEVRRLDKLKFNILSFQILIFSCKLQKLQKP